MFSYKELVKRFGSYLSNPDFKSFLENTFPDLSEYNVLEHSYMISESSGLELGFTNEDAIFDDDTEIVFEEGNPIFSHFIFYPKANILFNEFPFGMAFTDKRDEIFDKAGQPSQTKEGDFLGSPFLIDHYKVDNTVISIDYDKNDMSIKFVQIRDNDLVEHLRI
jgi:hypothetical protein